MARINTQGGQRLINLGIEADSFNAQALTPKKFELISSENACALIDAINYADHEDRNINDAFEDALRLLRDDGEEQFVEWCGKHALVRDHGLQVLRDQIARQAAAAADPEYLHELDDYDAQDDLDEEDMIGNAADALEEDGNAYLSGDNDGNYDSD